VIDQHREPVAGATIKYSGGGYVYATGSLQEEIKADLMCRNSALKVGYLAIQAASKNGPCLYM